jgi:predicted nucleic-acid-binding Zn-ribbon protein
MKIYKVWIQIEEIDEKKEHYLNIGEPYEAGKFRTEIAARKFVENELMIIRPLNTKLHRACQQVLDCLDVGGEQSRQFAEEIKILRDALNSTPMVKDDCPKCGAGSDERELTGKDFLDIEAIHMHYTCKKCGSEIIEEFTLSDVFIDDSHT